MGFRFWDTGFSAETLELTDKDPRFRVDSSGVGSLPSLRAVRKRTVIRGNQNVRPPTGEMDGMEARAAMTRK